MESFLAAGPPWWFGFHSAHSQLAPIADNLSGQIIDNCGHIIPLDRPDELLALLTPFLA